MTSNKTELMTFVIKLVLYTTTKLTVTKLWSDLLYIEYASSVWDPHTSLKNLPQPNLPNWSESTHTHLILEYLKTKNLKTEGLQHQISSNCGYRGIISA